VMTKPEVQSALKRLTAFLQNRRAHVTAVYLPPTASGGKQGVDDFLAAGHTRAELESLAQVPRPAPAAATPDVELLQKEPPTIRRPLSLIDGVAYATTWLHVRLTVHESVNKAGEVVRHNPPLVRTERRPFVVRGDGRVFGDGGDAPIDDLGAEVVLPEVPQSDKLWSRDGLMAYRQGKRPDPVDVFARMVGTFDRFIDFGRSLGDQSTMTELLACYALATWFSGAFTVLGYLWPHGDRGSGKTQCMTLAAELSYLGQVILAGGSFASLRDLADYGATLAFDDAENMSDPRKTDPDKRALLLAGNRRGAFVTVKELTGEKQWRTRYVNAFCPRMYTATKLPDPILASRSIVVPLVRTANRAKANADVLDYTLWPSDRRALTDDLWALALEHLPELASWESYVNVTSSLAGRNLEPWRALLAVAAWLESCGVAGLAKRMEGVAVAYQSQRVDFEPGDMTALVIRAVCSVVSTLATQSTLATLGSGGWQARATSTQIATEASQIVSSESLPIDPVWVTPDRVGRRLAALRIPQERTKAREWVIHQTDMQALVLAYSLESVCKVP
jgi:hypothetical protein